MEATWKIKGLYKADAEKVNQEILAIGNSATAAEILEKARDENTELHKCFEWDDTIAAEKYRLHQARLIVCNLVFKAPEPNQVQIRTLHFIESEKAYVSAQTILENRDTYQELLKKAYAELQCFRAKYKNLSELEQVFEAIENIA